MKIEGGKVEFPEEETHMYAVKKNSPALKMLREAIPIKPGQIFQCTDEQYESWKNDVYALPLVIEHNENNSQTDQLSRY